MKYINKYSKSIFLLLGVALVFALPLLAPVLIGVASVSYAGIITNPPTIDKIDTDNSAHLKRSVSKFVTLQKPSEYAFSTFIDSIGKTEKVINRKHQFQSVTYKGFEDAMGAAYVGASDTNAALTVDNVAMWDVDDTLEVAGTNGVDSKPLILKVVSKTSSKINVTALNGANMQEVPSIAENAVLYKIAPAKSELDIRHTTSQTFPVNDYNYIQTFMTEIAQGELESVVQSESGYSYHDRRLEKLYEMKSSREKAFLFGARSLTVDPVDNENTYTMGGVARQLSQTVQYTSGGPTISDIIDMLETVYASSAGSDKRVILLGRTLASRLDKIAIEKNVMSMESEVVHGVRVKRLVSSHGDAILARSRAMDNHGWGTKALVIDMDQIVKGVMMPMKAHPLDLKKAGASRVINAVSITEDCTLHTRYSGAGGPHCIWESA